MPKITPFLWFESKAKEAADYYVSIFPNSKVLYSNEMSTNLSLDGEEIIILNGGPDFKLNEAFSLFVNCADQAEVDKYWERFIGDGGEEQPCGWLKDKYGVSWQIIPKVLWALLGDPEPKKAKAAQEAMFKMKKIVIADLQKAHDEA